MAEKEITTDQVEPSYFIDLDWLQQNNRSFSILVRGYLCPRCRERLQEEISPDELLTTIKDCCSKTAGFITNKLPILESIFRLFLANGNQPLEVEELRKQWSEWYGGDIFLASAEVLSRLLRDEQYYGIRRVTG